MTGTTLRDLFDAALAQPPATRDAWLAANCADATMRARLARMLAEADDAAGETIPFAPAPALAAAIGEAAPLPPGTRVGPFELVELLGEGGHATVFRATRESEGVRQDVALKLLRHGIYTPHAQRQFRRERQALAQLRHPNIARLIEGGVTPAGLAYIALELVDGVPITHYARDRALDLRARLALFVQACRAVEAAHHALIVHRDLKPSNVLVTATGRVQLIDFGIAKIIDEDDDTQTGSVALTPAYAAPEQHRGEAITTATDVYALGVLLGELVTGERVNDGTGRTPSQRVAASRGAPAASPILGRQLRGDLDNIVLKAIAAEPGQRYPSAGALADDIVAFLDGRPVAAHPPSRLYRARKFVARHRGGVLSAMAFTLAMLAALFVVLAQSRVARSEARRASEVQHFLEALFERTASGNENADAPTLRELVRRGRERIEARPPEDDSVRAQLLTLFARINEGMGEVRENVAPSHAAWQAAVTAWGPDDRRTLEAQLLHARTLRRDGQIQETRAQLVDLRARMERQRIGGLLYSQMLDTALNAMEVPPRPADVVPMRQEILRLREGDPASTPDDIAAAWNNLGSAYELVRDYDAAEAPYRRAYEMRMAYLGDSAGAALSLGNVGSVVAWRKQWTRALDIFAQSRAIYARANITRHPNLAGLLMRICDLQVQREDRAAARRDCAEALAVTEATFGTAHPQYATAVQREAARRLAAGEVDAAREGFARARAILRAQEGGGGEREWPIDIAESPRWRLTGDWATLRDRLLPIVDRPAYADHWAAPTLFAWVALACHHAPSPACGDHRVADAEAILAKSRFAVDPLRVPARTALARIAPPAQHAQAAAALADELARTDEIGADHSWRAEAQRVLAVISPDAAARRAAADEARRIIATLPPGHLLHGDAASP